MALGKVGMMGEREIKIMITIKIGGGRGAQGRGLEIIINNASFGRLIRLRPNRASQRYAGQGATAGQVRLRRNRTASRRGIILLIILLERSSILLPQASSEALFDLISVVIRVICGRFCGFCAFCG